MKRIGMQIRRIPTRCKAKACLLEPSCTAVQPGLRGFTEPHRTVRPPLLLARPWEHRSSARSDRMWGRSEMDARMSLS